MYRRFVPLLSLASCATTPPWIAGPNDEPLVDMTIALRSEAREFDAQKEAIEEYQHYLDYLVVAGGRAAKEEQAPPGSPFKISGTLFPDRPPALTVYCDGHDHRNAGGRISEKLARWDFRSHFDPLEFEFDARVPGTAPPQPPPAPPPVEPAKPDVASPEPEHQEKAPRPPPLTDAEAEQLAIEAIRAIYQSPATAPVLFGSTLIVGPTLWPQLLKDDPALTTAGVATVTEQSGFKGVAGRAMRTYGSPEEIGRLLQSPAMLALAKRLSAGVSRVVSETERPAACAPIPFGLDPDVGFALDPKPLPIIEVGSERLVVDVVGRLVVWIDVLPTP